MGSLSWGQTIGNWKSTFGTAAITVKDEIGRGFASREAAAKAAAGQQAVLTQESDGHFHAYRIDDGARFDDLELGKQVSLKGSIPNVNVLDVVGKDNFQVLAERKTLPPVGPDNGKAVYFMRTMLRTPHDTLKERVNNALIDLINPIDRWDEEVMQARRKGYTVIVDNQASKDEMLAAFYDSRSAAVIFHGHGSDGAAVVEHNGKDYWLTPADIDRERVSPHLKFVMWQSCRTNSAEAEWEHAFKGADVLGWKRTEVALEGAAANDPHLFSLAGPIGLSLSVAADMTGKRIDKLIDKHL